MPSSSQQKMDLTATLNRGASAFLKKCFNLNVILFIFFLIFFYPNFPYVLQFSVFKMFLNKWMGRSLNLYLFLIYYLGFFFSVFIFLMCYFIWSHYILFSYYNFEDGFLLNERPKWKTKWEVRQEWLGRCMRRVNHNADILYNNKKNLLSLKFKKKSRLSIISLFLFFPKIMRRKTLDHHLFWKPL